MSAVTGELAYSVFVDPENREQQQLRHASRRQPQSVVAQLHKPQCKWRGKGHSCKQRGGRPSVEDLLGSGWRSVVAQLLRGHEDNRPGLQQLTGCLVQDPDDDAPTDLPTGEQLYKQAQSARTQATSGSDGWLPAELKYLPIEAWHERSRVMSAYVRAGKYPSAYFQVNAPTIPKKPGEKENGRK